jgi:RimJ/RimL family protein N-acetyltransferase
VSGWFLDDLPATPAVVNDTVNRFITNYDDRIGITWAIESRESGKLLGMCGYERVEVGAEGEIGFDLARADWGKGLMTEALRAILAFGFATMDLKRIVADTRTDNARAIRLLERLGFHGGPQGDGSSRLVLVCADWGNAGA